MDSNSSYHLLETCVQRTVLGTYTISDPYAGTAKVKLWMAWYSFFFNFSIVDLQYCVSGV